MTPFNLSDLVAIAPEIAILVLAAAVLKTELFFTRNPAVLQGITVGGLMVAGAIAAFTAGAPGGAFNGMMAQDGFTTFLKVLLIGVAALTAVVSKGYFEGPTLTPPVNGGGSSQTPPPTPPASGGGNSAFRHGEFYCLLLLTTVGMMALAAATDMVTLFIGLETMSVGLYVLAGLRFNNPRSSEASLKYLLLGAFASGFLLYGIALIYGATGGHTNFNEIATSIRGMGSDVPVILYAGVALVLVGLLFKVAAVPFHFWSPDVYRGAPTPVTAFMSAGPKAAAIAVFIRLMGWALPDLSEAWIPVLWVVAAATMTVGNFIALYQRDIKRMLAYSSISHAGYLLLAILAVGNGDIRSMAASGALFYLAAYYLMNLGAFTAAMLVNQGTKRGGYLLDDYQGLASQKPMLALGMTLFMISLAGIPPTAGFFGKLFVFSAAVKAGYVWLVVIAVLNSVVSAFYYLRPVVFMYMKPQVTPAILFKATGPAYVIGICAALILALGLLPSTVRKLADAGADQIVTPIPTIADANADVNASLR